MAAIKARRRRGSLGARGFLGETRAAVPLVERLRRARPDATVL
jgi:hypothetical protein